MKFERTNSLFLPKKTEKEKQKEIAQDRAKMPMFRARLFECCYESDVERFKNLLISKNAHFECMHVGAAFNCINKINRRNYFIIYQYYEDIGMEVLC